MSATVKMMAFSSPVAYIALLSPPAAATILMPSRRPLPLDIFAGSLLYFHLPPPPLRRRELLSF